MKRPSWHLADIWGAFLVGNASVTFSSSQAGFMSPLIGNRRRITSTAWFLLSGSSGWESMETFLLGFQKLAPLAVLPRFPCRNPVSHSPSFRFRSETLPSFIASLFLTVSQDGLRKASSKLGCKRAPKGKLRSTPHVERRREARLNRSWTPIEGFWEPWGWNGPLDIPHWEKRGRILYLTKNSSSGVDCPQRWHGCEEGGFNGADIFQQHSQHLRE